MSTSKASLNQKFQDEYQKLNTEQKKAVDRIDGPVMVIAGPGTGKTQILAARIGRILMDTDAQPENILCLTYTDAGAIAMRKRLQYFIGPDAYKVNLYTFHAFCNDVIQANLPLFEKSSLDAISELESIQLFKQLIDTLPKNNPLKRYRGDVYYEINNLRRLFSDMKKEGWDKPTIINAIDQYIDDLPNREGFTYKRKYKQYNAGDLNTAKYQEAVDKMEKLRAAVEQFERYQELMREQNRYDFDDMINWVIQAFENNPGLLSRYQEQFQYILVDEFQDTSGTQNKLIKLLINYWDEPNVFVVGDDDQSIYRFQGANVENMQEFANTYSNVLYTVVLTDNYRSTQPILDVSKSIIENNQDRLVNYIPGLSKNLIAAHPLKKELMHPPIIHEYNSTYEEMAGLTAQVSKLLLDGVAPGRIAVIYKENKFGEELTSFFKIKNIPVYSKRKINILNHSLVRKIILILEYVNAETNIPFSGDAMLFEILHYDFYKIPPIEIARLSVEAGRKRKDKEETSIRELLASKIAAQSKQLFNTPNQESMKIAATALEELIADANNITLLQLFATVIQKASILKYIMESEDRIALLQVLTTFFDFVKEECSRNKSLDLDGLIAVITLMKSEGIALPLNLVTGNESGVNLLTTHGSKGLEFEYVFFAGLNAGVWEGKRKPGGGYSMPDTLIGTTEGTVKNAEGLEELTRLFYVGITRAETHLRLSYAKHKNDGKLLEPSKFIQEIKDCYQLDSIAEVIAPEELANFAELLFKQQIPQIETLEPDFITEQLNKFNMNVTALNNYLDCPLSFYYKNLVRIPVGINEATVFGSAIHAALEKLFTAMQQTGNNTFPPLENFLKYFTDYMKRNRHHFTIEAYNRKIEYGLEILKLYYEKYVGSWKTIVAVEVRVQGVTIQGVPIRGQLDKLEFNGKSVNVVDYKSGSFENAKNKLQHPNEKEPLGGAYWRQAVFYKILVDNYSQRDWNVVSTEFDFVEPDSKKQYQKVSFVISPKDVEIVKQQIVETWEKIQTRQFYTGCGKATCHWCNFVKDNKLAVSLLDIEE